MFILSNLRQLCNKFYWYIESLIFLRPLEHLRSFYLFGLDFRVDNKGNDYVFSKCKPVLGKQINFPWFHIRLVPFKVIEKENTMQWHDFLANKSWFLGQIVLHIHICKSPHWSTLTFHRLNMPFQTKCHKPKHFLFVFFRFQFKLINICKFGADKMDRVIFDFVENAVGWMEFFFK